MKKFNMKNIAISSLIAVSTCFAAIGQANAAPQPDTHHLTQKQKNAIEAKQKAKHNAELKAKAKHKAESKHHSDLKSKQKAKQKKSHHDSKTKHKDSKFEQDRKHG
ncbi:hypothetical protein [Psychrobacter fozii]|uniref:hypothetical protein n=1 Tax=Psychrobacter fozii TaxID=198480 RepID=UPI00191AEC8C|nr:hypothetical protein [Psychrobacter fozii]